MKVAACVVLAVVASLFQGCAAQKEPMDSSRYERAVQKQFDEEYQDRLKP